MTPYIITGLLGFSMILTYFVAKKQSAIYGKTGKMKFSGNEIIEKIFQRHNIKNISIKRVNESYQNKYYDRGEFIQLSPEVFNKKTVYSVAIGTHEAMHAVDYNIFRYLEATSIKIGQYIFLPLLASSFVLEYNWLTITTAVLYIILFLYKLFVITLDEIKMNRMAYEHLQDFCSERELKEIKEIYRMNAWTYIATTPLILVE